MWATGQSGGAPDRSCSLFGAPSAPALTSAHAVRALFTVPVALQATVGAGSCCSAWHTGQSGATPNSPVNYSGVAPRISEASKLELIHPGASITVRWCIGHCPVAPDSPVRQTRAAFGCLLLLLFEPFLGLFIGLC
jgi:hypothetical protein